MTIMPFEGLMDESLEDAFGILPTTDADENPLDPADEAYYCQSILSGEHDEDEADRERDDFDPDFGFLDTYEADRAADRWERNFWGD